MKVRLLDSRSFVSVFSGFVLVASVVAIVIALSAPPQAAADWPLGCCANSDECQGTDSCWAPGDNGAPTMPCSGGGITGYCMAADENGGGGPPEI